MIIIKQKNLLRAFIILVTLPYLLTALEKPKAKTRVISSAISLDLHMKLRMEAARLDMTLSDYIRYLLDKELKGGK